ncbi:MAG: transcriptional repressor [Candidatus Pacebacteria bacterium]|nr:transcriptional repressor [Candidatus Paceibacterota bacterium]
MILEIEKKLKQAGYKLTKPRLEIIKALSLLKTPISAQVLSKKIKKIDRASVYRTLNLFFDLGLVNKETVNREALYCLAIVPHHHIVCRNCGYIESIPCRHEFENIKNFKDIRHQLTLSGLCSKCL